MSTRLHAIRDSQRRPLSLFVPARQASDYIAARALLSTRGCDVLGSAMR